MTNDFNFIDSPRENGIVEFYTDHGTESYKTIQCKHCGVHWQYVRGSGKQRGYCTKCNGFLCGVKECVEECVPFEAQLELYEGNKTTILKYGSTNVGRRILAEVESAKHYDDFLRRTFGDVPIIGG